MNRNEEMMKEIKNIRKEQKESQKEKNYMWRRN